jgi:CRP-like cAMP-binding protein
MQSQARKSKSLRSEISATRGVLAVLSEPERKEILKQSKPRILDAGSYLIRAGDRADNFFIILSGQLEVSRTTKQGKSIVLNRVAEGDVVGEIGALGGVARTADVVCKTPCTVAEISLTRFQQNMSSFPAFAAYVMKCLARRISRSTDMLFDIATEDVPSRVLQALRGLEAGPVNQQFYLIRERPTHAELARMVGTSREVVGRALTLLEKSGEIQQDGKSIFVRLP